MKKKRLDFLKILAFLFITIPLLENCSSDDEVSTINTINESNNSNLENNNSDNTPDGETNSNPSSSCSITYSLTSANGSDSQTVSMSKAITNIEYTLTTTCSDTLNTAVMWTPSTPNGVTMSFSNNVATISGTPTETATGTYGYKLTASDKAGTASITFTGSLTVSSSTSGSQEIPSTKIWNGSLKSFVKEDDKDPNNELNQDRITDNVWITRGNKGGQIYNAAKESNDDKTKSPIGTQWAIGSLDKVNDLSFKDFRSAVGSPKSVVGKDLVLYLVDDDIYLSVKFKSWSQGKKGGFSYDRSIK